MASTFTKEHGLELESPTAPPNLHSTVEDQGLEAFKDVTFGSIAGIIGKVIEYPFDTIKVRLQSQPHPPVFAGPLDCFRQSLLSPEGGLRSLYRGISAPLLGAAVETSSLFFSYRIAQSALQKSIPTLPQGKGEKLPLNALIACGAISGAVTSLLLTPIELVKCKMQYPVSSSNLTTSAPRGSISVIASVFRQHGILGFWRGQFGTLIRETGGSAAWFGSYEGVLIALRRSSSPSTHPSPDYAENAHHATTTSPLHHQLLAGASAGIAYNFAFFPADTIKARMQTEELASSSSTPRSTTAAAGGTSPRTTFWKSGVELWRQQGLKGLYRGCGITVARSAPSSAVIFTLYEGLREWAG
ncbi:MAG: hypothetical protein LQ344_007625 [Seirophora lacunosa]|nr:MAG: hypothetical protein LQ344_007625 [Seirophora lacunosa]